jgi:hypothetical protein
MDHKLPEVARPADIEFDIVGESVSKSRWIDSTNPKGSSR